MKRGAGVLLHVSSLPSSFGIGDLGAGARHFADRLAEMRQSFWQVLPLNPPNAENGDSPYFSASAFAGNPLFIDLESLAEEGLLDAKDIATAAAGDAGMVDFDTVKARKLPLVERACAAFLAEGGSSGFEDYCNEKAWWLDDYAMFASLRKRYGGRSWSSWPDDIRRRTPAALQKVRGELEGDIRIESAAQFLFSRQWQALKGYCNDRGIEIIGDLPIYVSYESADVWSFPQLFKLDGDLNPTQVSGVPPDYFSATGQLWNNPVYSWGALKDSGYDWWIRRIRATLDRFDMVRIDHFRGLLQYWEVPAGETTAINGAWRDVPTYDFLDTMIGRLGGLPVIAEDLGVITPDVRDCMDRYGFPGMRVLLFAFGDYDPEHLYLPHAYVRNCVVYTGTHDNNTFRGWLEGEAADKERAGLFRYLGRTLPVEEAARELIRCAFMSVADMVIIPLQDHLVLGAESRMNNPARIYGNWRWRCTEEQMDSLQVDAVREMTAIYGRGL